MRRATGQSWIHYCLVLAAIAFSTWVALQVGHNLADSVSAILFLVVVFVTAATSGLRCALWASFLSTYAWLYFFVPPLGSLYVEGFHGVFASVLYVTVAVTTGQMMVAVRRREQEARALYDLSQAILSDAKVDELLDHLVSGVVAIAGLNSAVILRSAEGQPRLQRALSEGSSDQQSTFNVPLTAEDQLLGLLVVTTTPGTIMSAEQELLVRTAANYAVAALQRDRLVRVAAEVEARLEVERLKASLLSSVSHDLRTPLASIKAAAFSISAEDVLPDDATRLQAVQSIVRNTDRLDRLVSNMLNMSRLEAGAWQPRKEFYPICEILATVLGHLDDNEARRLLLHVDDLPLVPLDEQQIEQVLWNLLENAVKYSPPASPMELSARVESGFLAMTLRDHGPGIPPGEEQNIFRKFYRAHRGGEGGAPGVGVGLAICKEIVEAHGGRIVAGNAPDGGACFTFFLPLEITNKAGMVRGNQPICTGS